VSFSLPRRTQFCIAGFSLFASLGALCPAADTAAPAAVDWTLTSQNNDISIYSRIHTGTTIKEFKAVGSVSATPRSVMAVLDDVENYPHFMPYITECRIIKRDSNSIISYQRISPPFCTDRDYSLRVRHEIKPTTAGPVYFCRWEQANALGPAEKSDALRVKINEGSWSIEPAPNNTSRATYIIYTDSGGALPAWLATKANQIAIDKLFEAIRKQVKDAKYTTSS
jgi:hypothetical protein